MSKILVLHVHVIWFNYHSCFLYITCRSLCSMFQSFSNAYILNSGEDIFPKEVFLSQMLVFLNCLLGISSQLLAKFLIAILRYKAWFLCPNCRCWEYAMVGKVNSVQEACSKCFAVHLLKFEILQTT